MWQFLRELIEKRPALASSSLPSLLKKVPGILWTTDKELRLTFLAGSGLPINEDLSAKVGEPLTHLFPNSAAENRVATAHSQALRGVASTFDINVTGRCLEAQIEPLTGVNGEIEGVIGAAFDYTERRVAERALRLSEQSYRSLFEDAPYAICRSTPSGQLLQTNRVMAEMLGYDSAQELLLRDLPEIFCDSGSFWEFSDRLKRTGALQGFECKWRRRDNKTLLMSLGARSVRDEGGQTSYIELFADNVGERKHLGDQLRHAQKMQAIGQLAGGIAHDFNNILTVVSGQVELFFSERSKDDPGRRRLEEIEKAAQRASTLTRKLLAFSRKQVLQSKVLDLNAVIASMNQMLERLIGEHIQLDFRPGNDLWNVKADPSQIEQVLMNLAVNARDAMSGGGRLAVTTRNAHLPEPSRAGEYVNSGEYVAIAVTDTGHGMDADVRTHIFEPFYTTKTSGKGTGLGLAMVYGIVKQSGGYIWVDSEPAQGATFEIFLPRVHESIEDEPAALPRSIPGGTETILIAEDEEKVRQMLVEFLEKTGYHVLAAADGQSAKALADVHFGRVNLLLTDVVMPTIGGFELAEDLIKKIPQLKVLFISGYPGNLTSRKMLFESGYAFVQKPFSLQSLALKVRQLLDSPSGVSVEGGLRIG